MEMDKNFTRLKRTVKFLPFYAVSILPMTLLYRLSDGLYIITYHFLKYRNTVVQDNIRKSFPEMTEVEIQNTVKGFYRHFCDVIVEAIKGLTMNEKNARERITIKNPELIEHFLDTRRSILMYTAHQGNWEWLVLLPLYFDYPAYTFYRPLKNSYFNELVLLIRERFGVRCVAADKGYRSILNQIRSNRTAMNCVIGDQSPTRRFPKQWHQFLNQNTAFFIGAEKLAKKTGQVVIFPTFEKIKRGYYSIHFQLLEQFPKNCKEGAITQYYATQLEAAIKMYPELWLWSHRRWKLTA